MSQLIRVRATDFLLVTSRHASPADIEEIRAEIEKVMPECVRPNLLITNHDLQLQVVRLDPVDEGPGQDTVCYEDGHVVMGDAAKDPAEPAPLKPGQARVTVETQHNSENPDPALAAIYTSRVTYLLEGAQIGEDRPIFQVREQDRILELVPGPTSLSITGMVKEATDQLWVNGEKRRPDATYHAAPDENAK